MANTAPKLGLADQPIFASPWDRVAWVIDLVKSGRLAGLQPAARAVLISLFAHANTTGEAWPSVETLKRLTGLTSRSVERARKQLVELGLLIGVSGGGGRRSAHYRLQAPTPVSGQPRHLCRGSPDTGVTQSVVSEEEPMKFDDDPHFSGYLFGGHHAHAQLVARGFRSPDAGRLIAAHGADRVLLGVEHVDLLDRLGEIQRSYRGALYTWLVKGYAPDVRLAREHAHRAARQRHNAAVEADRLAMANEQGDRTRERRRVMRVFGALSEGECERLRQQVIQAMAPDSRRFHAGRPATNPVIRAAIVAMIEDGPMLW